MFDIVKDLLPEFFQGVNLVIACIAMALMALCAWWIFAKKAEQKKAKKLFWRCCLIGLVAGFAMVVNYWREKLANTFPKGVTGVLVLGIVGDDQHSLQRDLVSNLNHELTSAGLASHIIVRAFDEQLDDTKLGISIAQLKARGIGRQFNAQIVVWGNRVGEKKFWPRITIVNQSVHSVLSGERELNVQEIDQLRLPLELVESPVFLASFISGLSFYDNGRYAEALECIESASKFTGTNSADFAPLNFYAATCRIQLSENPGGPKDLLVIAIRELQSTVRGLSRSTGSFCTRTIPTTLGDDAE